ncbi:MAG TPA: ABC transporter substrate-binding protein [bacterium]|nr:ABC transporter substrate-binding protein [bacterium]
MSEIDLRDVARQLAARGPRVTRRALLRQGLSGAAAAAILGASGALSPGGRSAGLSPAAALAASSVGAGPKTLTMAQAGEPSTLDPQFEQSGIIGTYLNAMMEHVMEFDRNLSIKNVLAQTSTPPKDGVTYRFRLRSNMKFWDGEPVDAAAVKFTYERGLSKDNRAKGLSDPVPVLQGVDHVRVVDPLTVEVVTAKPSTLAWPFFCQEFILAPKHYESLSFQDAAIKPMGSGPWRFAHWTKGDRLEMTANADYWRGKPQIDNLVFRTVPDASTRLAMLERGEVDIITDVDPDDLATIRGNAKLRAEAALTTFRVHIGVPCNQAKWKDRRARTALNYAINVDNIIKYVLGGIPKERLRTPVITPGWPNAGIKPYPFDPAKAKELLNAAGFDWNQKVTLYTITSGMKRLDVAQAIVADLKKLGMSRAEVQVLQSADFTSKLKAKEFDDLYLNLLGAPSYGPIEVALPTGDLALDSSHFTDATQNGPKYLEMYHEVRETFDTRRQHDLVNQLQALFMEESAWILLYREAYLFGVNKRTDWRPTSYTRIHFWLPDERDARIIG